MKKRLPAANQETPRRPRKRKSLPRLLFVSGVVFLGLVVSVRILVSIDRAYADFHAFDNQARQKQAQFAALEAQSAAAGRRLKMLDSSKGRAQILVERGYVRPGERILLFPEESASGQNAVAPRRETNDLVAPREANAETLSPLQRAGHALGRMWQTVRGAGRAPKRAAAPAASKEDAREEIGARARIDIEVR